MSTVIQEQHSKLIMDAWNPVSNEHRGSVDGQETQLIVSSGHVNNPVKPLTSQLPTTEQPPADGKHEVEYGGRALVSVVDLT